MEFSSEHIQDEVEMELRKSSINVLLDVAEFVGVPEQEREEKPRRELLRTIELQFDLTEERDKKEMFLSIISMFPDEQQLPLRKFLPAKKPLLSMGRSEKFLGSRESIALGEDRPNWKMGRLEREFSGSRNQSESINDTIEVLKQLGINSGVSSFRKDFKISGVIGGKTDQRVGYMSLLSQIAEGKQRGFKEEEISFGVRRAVSQGSELRGYLDSLEKLPLVNLLGYIRSSYKEKGASELFQDLNRLIQKEGESCQDFLFRALGLRQKVLLASEAEGAIKYDELLVRSVFLHSLKTGFLNQTVRNHMSPFLDSSKMTPDSILISEVNKVAAEEQERLGKVKDNSSKKVQFDTKVQVCEVGVKQEITSCVEEVVKPLFESVKSLAEQVKNMQQQKSKTKSNSWRVPACQVCIDSGMNRCDHCKKCGNLGHQARECQALNG